MGVPLLCVLVLILLLLTDSDSPLGNRGNYSQFYILLLFPDNWDWEPWENLQQADTECCSITAPVLQYMLWF